MHQKRSPNGFSSRVEHFVVAVTLGYRVLECYIIDNLLFSDHVPLKIGLYLYVDHMLERNYCHMLPLHKASTERMGQYRSDLEFPGQYMTKGHCSVRILYVKNMLMNYLNYIIIY